MDYLFYSNMSQVFFLKILFLKLLLKLISEKQCEICQQSAEILLFFFLEKAGSLAYRSSRNSLIVTAVNVIGDDKTNIFVYICKRY